VPWKSTSDVAAGGAALDSIVGPIGVGKGMQACEGRVSGKGKEQAKTGGVAQIADDTASSAEITHARLRHATRQKVDSVRNVGAAGSHTEHNGPSDRLASLFVSS
jgi:hypothetical protein